MILENTTRGLPTGLIKGAEVKQTNTDLPNTYRRSTTETIMHLIGQNILLIYPHFGIDFLHDSCQRRICVLSSVAESVKT